MKKFLKTGSIIALVGFALNSCSRETLEDSPSSPQNSILSRTTPTNNFTTAYNYLGSGYDATEEFANENSTGNQIIDINKFLIDYPTRVITEYPLSQEYVEEYGENAQKYSQAVTNKVDIGFSIPIFKQVLTSSFSSSQTSTNKFDAKYIYASYNLMIKQRRYRFNSTASVLKDYLTDDFKNDLLVLSPQQIVQYYGTHVLLDLYTGAKMEVKFQSETNNQDRTYASRVGIKTGVKDIFNIDISNGVDTSSSLMNYNRKLSYRTRGGDPSKGFFGDLNLDQSNPQINISNWQNSSTPDNSVMVDIAKYGLVLIYDLVSDPTKKAQLKVYVDQYLIDNQVNLDYIAQPIYRYYNGGVGDHFYTRTSGGYPSWGYEGVAFNAYSYKAVNTVPVYRYWNGRDHFYTTEPGAPTGYSSEGIEFYAFNAQLPGTVPIYRYYNSRTGDHFYVRQAGSYNGYAFEGIAFFAY